MMRQYELVEKVLSYDPKADETLLNRAYVYAMRAHGTQKRADGAPYFSHPLEVAAILTEFKLDDATIATALLHDVIEDTDATRSEIDQLFGPEIGTLVDGLTKIKKLDLVTKEAQQAENFRKLLIAISTDIRVLLVKLADRLHNMRTLEHKKPASRMRTSQETIDIYAPLAGLMGIQALRDELEDHAFRWLHPEAHATVMAKLTELRKRNENLVEDIRQSLSSKLSEAGLAAEVTGREKRPYAIWRKMENKQISLEQLSDIYAFRIIVGDIDDCYRVLGIVHRNWQMVPGRFKDYISVPKRNNYRSLHTTLIGPRAQRVELQIRTREMHEVAEFGVAAHALYKNGMILKSGILNGAQDEAAALAAALNGAANGEAAAYAHALPAHATGDPEIEQNPYFRLRQLVGTLLEGSNSEEFLEHTKLELFHDQVFCFTPKGRLIALPHGATALDFAYAVHTDIGNSCVGAKIDGIRVPLWTRLKNGQSVEVITATGQRPQATWIDIVVTGRAKSAIRRSLREEDRERFIKLGRELARVAFEHHGRKVSDKALRTAAKTLGLADEQEVLARLGSAELTAREVIEALYPELATQPVTEEVDARRPVVGLTADQSFRRANCCQPVPGERIVGITYRGQGVVVHAIDCPALAEFEEQPGRWVDLQWHSGRHAAAYTISLNLTITNDAGVLGRICTLIGEQKANISDLTFVDRKPDFYRLIVEVDLRDAEHLHMVLTALEAESDVAQVERYRDLGRKP